MPKLSDLRPKKEVIQEIKEDVSKPVSVLEKPITKPQPKAKPKAIQETEDLKKLTMDQIRALLLFVCNESPKHNSSQTKEVLINKIVNKLNNSK